MTIEKRQKIRKSVDTATPVLNLHSGEHFGYLVNITKKGFMLSSDFLINPNCIYQVTINIQQDNFTLEVGAESLWSESSLEQDLFWTGFRIIDISKANQQSLEAYA